MAAGAVSRGGRPSTHGRCRCCCLRIRQNLHILLQTRRDVARGSENPPAGQRDKTHRANRVPSKLVISVGLHGWLVGLNLHLFRRPIHSQPAPPLFHANLPDSRGALRMPALFGYFHDLVRARACFPSGWRPERVCEGSSLQQPQSIRMRVPCHGLTILMVRLAWVSLLLLQSHEPARSRSRCCTTLALGCLTFQLVGRFFDFACPSIL